MQPTAPSCCTMESAQWRAKLQNACNGNVSSLEKHTVFKKKIKNLILNDVNKSQIKQL
jgi:hypothetical protein